MTNKLKMHIIQNTVNAIIENDTQNEYIDLNRRAGRGTFMQLLNGNTNGKL
jgi:hypothetical protein